MKIDFAEASLHEGELNVSNQQEESSDSSVSVPEENVDCKPMYSEEKWNELLSKTDNLQDQVSILKRRIENMSAENYRLRRKLKISAASTEKKCRGKTQLLTSSNVFPTTVPKKRLNF